MSHLAIVAPPFLGHLNPSLALAATLRTRGHRTTLFGIGDLAALAVGAGCDFVPLGALSHPPGTLTMLANRLAAPGGFGLVRVMRDMAAMTRMFCAELPAACRSAQIDALVVDQLEPAGGLVAAHLGLPFVSVANALPLHREPLVPPPFTGWRYDATAWGIKRNLGGYRVADALLRPVTTRIAQEAARLGLTGRSTLESCLSPLADITQIVPELDFPRRCLAGTVHPCGPLRSPEAEDVGATWPEGDRPRVFASLGSLQGGRGRIFTQIARACADLGLPLVIAHGGRLDAAQAATLPGKPVVRAFVPQQSQLRHSDLLVTNGGLNTVLDGAAAGVPMLVIPIAFEQGAIAARVHHAGVARVVSRYRLGRLRDELARLAGDAVMRQRARQIGKAVQAAGGAETAADVIETVLRTGQPVLRAPRSLPLMETA